MILIGLSARRGARSWPRSRRSSGCAPSRARSTPGAARAPAAATSRSSSARRATPRRGFQAGLARSRAAGTRVVVLGPVEGRRPHPARDARRARRSSSSPATTRSSRRALAPQRDRRRRRARAGDAPCSAPRAASARRRSRRTSPARSRSAAARACLVDLDLDARRRPAPSSTSPAGVHDRGRRREHAPARPRAARRLASRATRSGVWVARARRGRRGRGAARRRDRRAACSRSCGATTTRVVVDGLRGFDERALAALDASDRDPARRHAGGARRCANAQRCLELFRRLGYAQDKVQLVVNRFQKGASIAPGDGRGDARAAGRRRRVANDFPAVSRAVGNAAAAAGRGRAAVAGDARRRGARAARGPRAPAEDGRGRARSSRGSSRARAARMALS